MKRFCFLPSAFFSSLLCVRSACFWSALVALAVLAFEPQPTQAGVIEAWVHRYGNLVSDANDESFKIVRDASGDMIVTGVTDDNSGGSGMLTIKYSGVDGSVLWKRRYKGPAIYYATALAVDGSGNVVVTGTAEGGAFADSYTAKYAAADGALLWEKRYDDPVNGYYGARAVAVDPSGNVVLLGTSYKETDTDYYTAKYAAADGALLWIRRYNGPANKDDFANAVAVDTKGNVVVTGTSSNGGNTDYYTAKYAALDGALLWEKRYNGPANKDDYASAVAVDGQGNVVVTGSSSNSRNRDYYTAKYAAEDGALLWEKRYHSSTDSDDEPQAMALDGSGNVVVSGYAMTIKCAAADGALLWERPRSDNTYVGAVAVDGGGNVVVAGGFSLDLGDHQDSYTAKYAATDGALLWEQRHISPANGKDAAHALTADSQGNVVVTGYSGGDYYTAKYRAADGALVWDNRYDDPLYDLGSIVVDSSGNVVVAGSCAISSEGTSDCYTAKYAASNGALLWEKRSPGGGTLMGVDARGNVVVAGSVADTNGALALYTAKYAALDGALLWEKRHIPPANFNDKAAAMAVDGLGNVVVTGYSGNGLYAAKYATADGALLWEQHSASLKAVAVDGSGNVVLAGSSWNGRKNEYYTAKHAAADGSLLWEKRYNGPANIDDQAKAVAADGSGNVLVTGQSATSKVPGTVFLYDYYTAKYAAADGALLWERRYTGPGNGNDEVQSIALDGSGNAVVTGSSATLKYAADNGALLWEIPNTSYQLRAVALDDGGNVVMAGPSGTWPNSDYRTAKYAAADGALLWEEHYNGPANGDDYASSLAIGPNGMVAVLGSSSRGFGLGGYELTTVVYREVQPLSIERAPNGFRLGFTGIPGRSYSVERASVVTGPWTTINTLTVPASGLLEYRDTNSPVGTAFYRMREP